MRSGALWASLLTILPGAWIAFGFPLKSIPFSIRLILGVILTPLIVWLEFYLVRFAGLSFESAAILLTIINLPAAYLVYRQRDQIKLPDRHTWFLIAIVTVIILICIAPYLLDPQKRLYTWGAWFHADVIYSLANGHLVLEDAELAGIRLSYPWAGHVYQALVSYLSDSPPVSGFIWLNLVWLACIFGVTGAIVAELGGDRLAQIGASLWLSFGVNYVGGLVGPAIPQAWIARHESLANIWGDNRFSPWLDKILFFGQMYFGMGFFIAILYLMLKPWPETARRAMIGLTGLLLAGIALIYPVLLPPALAVIGARMLTRLLGRWLDREKFSLEEFLGLGVVMVLAGVLTFANTKFLTEGRLSNTVAQFNPVQLMRWRVAESFIVTLPLLAGLLAFGILRRMRARNTLMIVGIGALASIILYILFDIPWWRNEYKFMFTAAMCLAPFPSLAMQPVMNRLGRWAIPAFAVLAVALAAPYAVKVEQGNPYMSKLGPAISIRHFDLQLSEPGPLSDLVAAIRQDTPLESLLVLQQEALHLPSLTQRQLYVAPEQKEPYPGILITSDEMLTLAKGYSPLLLEDRRAVVRELYGAQDGVTIANALRQAFQLNRPLALVVDHDAQSALLQWLAHNRIGREVYEGDSSVLWLIHPEDFAGHETETP